MRRYLLALLAVLALAPPALAQTANTWTNQKINDMRAHGRDREFDSRANTHFQIGLDYLRDMDRLLDEERGPRVEKKLGKAYRRAVKNLEQAVDVEPEWVDAYVMLGSAHYKMHDYPAAKAAYQSALRIDPENQAVQGYLATVEWYIEHPQAADDDSASSGS